MGFLGATFKADIDDLRQSPALKIIKEFSKNYSGKVFLAEPNVKNIMIDGVEECSIEKILSECELVVMLVKHKEFKRLTFSNNILLDFVGVAND